MNRAEPSFRYTYGLSFPGEIAQDGESGPFDFRQIVRSVADLMSAACNNDQRKVLYDHYHKGKFAMANLDEYLPAEYLSCELVVVFLCKDYENKHWCQREWKVIQQLAKNPSQRHRVMFLWRGERNNEVLDLLGLNWKRDGFFEIDGLDSKEIWDEVHTRYKSDKKMLKQIKSQLKSNTSLAAPPMALAIGLPSVQPKKESSVREAFQRLALVLWPPEYRKSRGYAEAGRYELSFYVRSADSETYQPFAGLDAEIEFMEHASACQDWNKLAQSIVYWASKIARGDSRPLVELFLPRDLLQELTAMDFLSVPCKSSHLSKLSVSFASLCPVVVRPLDRYLRQDLIENKIHQNRKLSKLSIGRGRWIHGDDAASSGALMAMLESPEHVAVRMLNDLPSADWLDAMIESMVPLALWWALPGQHNREAHLSDYKSACGLRSLLKIGSDGLVTMLPNDLDQLPIQRKLLNHSPAARSLIIMIDNLNPVPDLLSSPLTSSTATPTYSVRSPA